MASRIVQVRGTVDTTFFVPVKRWSDGPDFRTIAKLEGVLAQMFAQTQAQVHIITGSLKLSGKTSSDYKKTEGIWEGEISYGGPSGGVHDPVRYAIFELARGGDHNFFNGLDVYNDEISEILNRWFEEG